MFSDNIESCSFELMKASCCDDKTIKKCGSITIGEQEVSVGTRGKIRFVQNSRVFVCDNNKVSWDFAINSAVKSSITDDKYKFHILFRFYNSQKELFHTEKVLVHLFCGETMMIISKSLPAKVWKNVKRMNIGFEAEDVYSC